MLERQEDAADPCPATRSVEGTRLYHSGVPLKRSLLAHARVEVELDVTLEEGFRFGQPMSHGAGYTAL